MRQSGKVFSLLKESELDEDWDLDLLELRTNKLIRALKDSGYKIESYSGKGTKYSILNPTEKGLEEIGILIFNEIYTRDSKKLEKFLQEYEIKL